MPVLCPARGGSMGPGAHERLPVSLSAPTSAATLGSSAAHAWTEPAGTEQAPPATQPTGLNRLGRDYVVCRPTGRGDRRHRLEALDPPWTISSVTGISSPPAWGFDRPGWTGLT